MDGVIVDSELQKARAFEQCMNEYGIKDGKEFYFKTIGILGEQRATRIIAERALVILPKQLND